MCGSDNLAKVSLSTLVRDLIIRLFRFCFVSPPAFENMDVSVGTTVSLGCDCFSVLVKVLKIFFSFVCLFSIVFVGLTIGYELEV